MTELTQAEIVERTALLKRFKTLLEQQRAKFKEYLAVLESQEKTITEENTEQLLAHTELEQQIAANIISLQKVIHPMEELYRNSFSETDSVPEIPRLQADLRQLQQQVLDRNKKNRDLLQIHITQIKDRLAAVKNPYRNARSIYAQTAHTASCINISI